jgi:hypothetical protein
MQPTRQPTRQPSAQPTVQPSNQPSQQPTSQPSTVPSAQPSSYPTPVPTQFFNASECEQRYQGEVLNATIPLDSGLYQIQYSELFFRYKQRAGSCAEWNSVRRSREIDTFISVRILQSLSLTTVKQIYDYYEILDRTPETVTCSNGTYVGEILRRLGDATTGNRTVRCDGYDWRIHTCYNKVPALCINCEDPCKEHCSNERYVNFISPCRAPEVCMDHANGQRNGLMNSIHILSAIAADKYPAPDITSVVAVAAKSSVTVTLGVDGVGGAYCGVFAPGTVPTSLDAIRFQNHIATANRTAAVTISGLTPATPYAVYCFTFSQSGASLPYKKMLAQGKAIFTTDCCKTVSVALKSVYTVEKRNYPDFLAVALDALPQSSLTVELQLIGAAAGAFFPQAVTFSASSASSARSIALTTKQLPPDQYTVTIVLSGASRSEYAALFAKNVSTFAVLSALAEPPAPRISVAAFSSTGSSLTLTFDSPTDQGGYTKKFDCSKLLTFADAAKASCAWQDNTNVIVYPYYKREKLSYAGTDSYNALALQSPALRAGSLVLLRNGTVKAQCTIADCKKWAYASSSVVVTAAVDGISPALTISSPLTVGGCDDLVIDVTSSSNDGGRAWQNLTLTVSSSSAAESTIANIQTFLDSVYVLAPPTPIPRSLLESDVEYTFFLGACNFYGKCSTVFQKVTALNATVPFVTITGSPSRDVYRYNSLLLDADAYVRECGGDTSRGHLQYTWTVKRNNLLVKSVASESNNPATFRLSPYKLEVGGIYYVYVTVVDAKSGASASNIAKVNVIRGSLVAAINGAGIRVVNTGEVMVLDAGNSYDQDYGSGTQLPAPTVFTWSCTTSSPDYSGSCALSYNATQQLRTLVVTGVVAGATSTVTVTVTDAFARQAQASVTIKVVQSVLSAMALTVNAPALQYSAVRGSFVMNANSRLILEGSVDLGVSLAAARGFRALPAAWSVDDTSISLSEAALTAVSTNIRPYISGKTLALNFALAPNVLQGGNAYTFSFTVTDKFASIVITVNQPPLPGSFSVTPNHGTEFSTKFGLLAFLWQDIDVPLTYAFGYYGTDGATVVLYPRSEYAYATSLLPCTTSNSTGSRITLAVTVFDSLNANNSATAQALVRRNESVSPAALSGAISDAIQSSQGDSRKLAQLVSVAGGIINTADCTKTNPNKCKNAYHREACAATDNTCGPCLTGYAGVDGDDNSVCVKTTVTSNRRAFVRPVILAVGNDTHGAACTTDDECLHTPFANCVSGYCIVPQRSCPFDCSAQGNCSFINSNTLVELDICLLDDPVCQAVCSCETGCHGSGCQYDEATYAAKAGTRQLLLGTLLSQSALADPTIDTVVSWVNSVAMLARAYDQLNEEGLLQLHDMLTVLLRTAESVDAPSTTLLRISQGLNSVMLGLTLVDDASISSAELTKLVSSFGRVLAASQLLGQEKMQIVTSELRMVSHVLPVISEDSLYPSRADSVAVLPQSMLESYANVVPTSMALPTVSGQSTRGYSAVGYMLKSHYFGRRGWYSNVVGYDYSSLDGQPLQIACADGSCEVELVLQYNQFIDRIDPHEDLTYTQCYDRDFYSVNYSCRTNPGHNITVNCPGIPGVIVDRCPILNASTVCLNAASANTRLANCDVRRVTDSNVTCLCSLASDNVRSMATGLSTALTFRTMSAQYTSGEFVRTLGFEAQFQANDATTEIIRSTLVLLSLLSYAAMLVLLATYTYSKDNLTDTAVMKKEARRRKMKKVFPDDEVLERAVTYDEHDEDSDSEDDPGMEKFFEVEYDQPLPSLQESGHGKNHAKELNKIDFTTMEGILPAVFRQREWRDKVYHELRAYHRWLNVLLQPSDYYSRMLRVFALGAQILCAGAFQAALFMYTDPDDHQCPSLTNERACISEVSPLIPNQSKCFWNLVSHTCHYRQPVVSFQTIAVVAGLSAAMSVPVARLMEYVLVKFTVPVLAPAASSLTQYSVQFKSPREIVKADSARKTFSGGLTGKHKILPVDGGHSDDMVPSTPTLIKPGDNVFSFNNVGTAVEAARLPNSNRIHCILFVNARPIEVELETFSRDLAHYVDSLVFLSSTRERDRLQSKLASCFQLCCHGRSLLCLRLVFPHIRCIACLMDVSHGAFAEQERGASMRRATMCGPLPHSATSRSGCRSRTAWTS